MAALHGKEFEKVALDCFVRYLEALSSVVEVVESALVVKNHVWPGASPDGIVTEDGEKHHVEIKCPYAACKMTIERH